MSYPINKRDLDIILEVNKKSIEIETEVAGQNEEIIELLQETIEYSKETDKKATQISGDVKTLVDIGNNVSSKTKDIDDAVDAFDKKIAEMSSSINKKIDDLQKDIFQIKILFSSGLISLAVQIIQMFIKK
jgi:ABC-type transporter Mla subunit MlaD